MAQRYRGRDVQIELHAVRNAGRWPEILKFLDDTGLSEIPMFGHPPITREEDGTLRIWPSQKPVPVGDWLALTAGRQIFVFLDDEFTHMFEPIKEEET